MKKFIKLYIFVPLNKIIMYIRFFFVPSALEKIKINRSCPIKIKTYEKSGQGVHPSLLYQPKENPAYVLAFTPYPFSMESFENPSLLVSRDGLRFFEEAPYLNPLVPPPQLDHNDDPDLFFYNDQYNIVYLETLRPKKQNIVLLSSFDRKNWTSRLIHTDFFYTDNPDPFILSPAFVRTTEKDYLFYIVMNRNSNNEIQYVPIEKNFNPNFSKRKKAVINLHWHNPWHIGIISKDNIFFMLICCKDNNNYHLFIARSNNVTDWDFSEKILLKNTYRSTGFIENNLLFLYYSRKNILGAWEMGIAKKNISGYI